MIVTPATKVIRVAVTPYATYLCSTCITNMGVARASKFTKKDEIKI